MSHPRATRTPGRQRRFKVPRKKVESAVPEPHSAPMRGHMYPTFSIPDLARLNLSPQARAKLSVLSFFLQQPAESVLDNAMSALINGLPQRDRELVLGLHSRFVPSGMDSLPDTGSSLADQIRAFVLAEYVQPARDRQEKQISLRVKDVHRRLGLVQRYPAIISALHARSFIEDQKLRLIEAPEEKQGSARVLVFDLL